MFSKVPPTDNDNSSDYAWFLLMSGLIFSMYFIPKFIESRNRLKYESRFVRELTTLLKVFMEMWHTNSDDVVIKDYEGQVIAVGPHRTGLVDGAVVASKMQGIPPHIFATDAYNFIPTVPSFLKMLQAITIKSNTTKDKIKGGNTEALVLAGPILKAHGSIALAPQGNMTKIGQEPHRVYDGAAKLAVDNNVPIRVIRIDNFWSIDNPFIPVFIRNWNIYRALLSAVHPNNVRVTDCGVIDFHLKEENANLPYDEKIKEINAQLYAYFRDSKNLTVEQVHAIKNTISDKTHHLIWDNKIKRDGLVKEIAKLDTERDELDKTAVRSHL